MKTPRFYVTTWTSDPSQGEETVYDSLIFARAHAENYLGVQAQHAVEASATIRVVFEDKKERNNA